MKYVVSFEERVLYPIEVEAPSEEIAEKRAYEFLLQNLDTDLEYESDGINPQPYDIYELMN